MTLEAKAIRPGPVTFVISNRGKVAHGFELKADDHVGGHTATTTTRSRRARYGREKRCA